MSSQYHNPRNAAAALWASAAEQAQRTLHPDLSTQELRNLPMMKAVYTQLRANTAGKLLPKPAANASYEDKLAYGSQHFLMLSTIHLGFTYIDEYDYDAYIDALNNYNATHSPPIPDFSTSDLGGFALCLIIWLGMAGTLNSTAQEGLNALIDWIHKEFPQIPQEYFTHAHSFINEIEAQHYSMQYRYPSDHSSYQGLHWKMDNNAQVIMLGDWGTGMDDAKAFLKAIWRKAFTDHPTRQIVFIHLGDIYYCGLPQECDRYFYQVFSDVSSELSTEMANDPTYRQYTFVTNPPIFTIPGNHEYYSNGYGYFQLLDTLHSTWNGGNNDKRQQCSFFCLRSEDGHWQFVGMDTGQADHNALSDALRGLADKIGLSEYVSKYEAEKNNLPSWMPDWMTSWPDKIVQVYYNLVGPFQPTLRPGKKVGGLEQLNEETWVKQRISEYGGKTILCSHHQLFSREATINYSSPQYLNSYLRKTFGNYCKDKVAAWYWGHEHTYAMYLDGIQGLNKGRLLGSSSYEATEAGDTPYANNYPMIPLSSHMSDNSSVGQNQEGIYDHAGAIFTFDDSSHDVQVKYYKFPAWSQVNTNPPSNPALTQLTSETISHDKDDWTNLSPTWIGNDEVNAGNVKTSSSPSVAYYLNTLYLVYRDSDNKLAQCTAYLTNFKPTSNTATLDWNSASEINVGSSSHAAHLSTSNSPTSVIAASVWYIFYVDSNNHIALVKYDISHGRWTNVGALLNAGSNLATTSAFSAAFYEGIIYLMYLDSSSKVCCASYDPLQTGNGTTVTAIGRISDSSGSSISASQVAVAGRSDTPSDHNNYLMVVITESDGDLKWTKTTNPGSAAGYSTLTKINVHKADGNTDDLKSSVGVSLTYFRNTFMMVRVDGSHHLKTSVFEPTSQLWYGDLEVDVHANDTSKSAEVAQSSHFPSLTGADAGVYLLYRGDDHTDIFWCFA